jgi:hypothetical protein
MAGAGTAVVLAEAIAAITAFGAGTLWRLAGFAVGWSVYCVAILIGVAAMLHQLGFVRLIDTGWRGFSV